MSHLQWKANLLLSLNVGIDQNMQDSLLRRTVDLISPWEHFSDQFNFSLIGGHCEHTGIQVPMVLLSPLISYLSGIVLITKKKKKFSRYHLGEIQINTNERVQNYKIHLESLAQNI